MDSDPEVRTTAGYVRGRRAGDVAIFRGIPYAMPPVGERRFKAPRPSPRWDGVRDALEFGPPAPQVMRDGDTPAWAARAFAADDWLTLNVWTPDLGGARLPVMAWIHGGGYQRDTSLNPHWDGATLARAGAVVVSMNYRLGVEGFAHVAGAPDNRGILDQIAALQWIQENIAAFGGDPGTVTVLASPPARVRLRLSWSCPGRRGCFAGRSHRACQARTSRSGWPPRSRHRSPLSSARVPP